MTPSPEQAVSPWYWVGRIVPLAVIMWAVWMYRRDQARHDKKDGGNNE